MKYISFFLVCLYGMTFISNAVTLLLGGCTAEGNIYNIGDIYNDGCYTCACASWGPVCNAEKCIYKREVEVTSCEHGGKTYALGQIYSTGSGCHMCRCEKHGPVCFWLPCRRRRGAITQ